MSARALDIMVVAPNGSSRAFSQVEEPTVDDRERLIIIRDGKRIAAFVSWQAWMEVDS